MSNLHLLDSHLTLILGWMDNFTASAFRLLPSDDAGPPTLCLNARSRQKAAILRCRLIKQLHLDHCVTSVFLITQTYSRQVMFPAPPVGWSELSGYPLGACVFTVTLISKST